MSQENVEIVRAVEGLFEQFESLRIELEELIDAGDRVIVVTTQHAVPKGGQQEIAIHMAELWTIRDRLLVERHSYSTRAQPSTPPGFPSRQCRRRTWSPYASQ